MITIQKITHQELENFVSSITYKELIDKPISVARADSYLKNPRANKKDTVLYLAFIENKLVAYRTILSDTFFINKTPVLFGWLSGSWVHEKHRRKGISTLLFDEVLKDWNGKLMYTNYADASKLLYDKTQQFSLLKELKGTKYYMRFSLADILPKKKKVFRVTKFFWRILDFTLNFFLEVKNGFKSKQTKNNFYTKKDESWKQSTLEFVSNFSHQNLFQRGEKEFNWIQNYPWILSDKKTKLDSKQYNFSSYSKEFKSNIYSVYNNDNNLIGILLMTFRDGHIKIPYVYFSEENSKEIVQFIISKCAEMKTKTIVIYHKKLEEALNNQLPFLTKKAFSQKYFMTKELEKYLKNEKEIEIQTGDGDVVFT